MIKAALFCIKRSLDIGKGGMAVSMSYFPFVEMIDENKRFREDEFWRLNE